jgi:hypothetical protein
VIFPLSYSDFSVSTGFSLAARRLAPDTTNAVVIIDNMTPITNGQMLMS